MGWFAVRACASICALVALAACSSNATSGDEASSDEIIVKPPSKTEEGSKSERRVRIMTGNLTSGDHQSYDLGHGARIFRALAPDVALIQELNVGDGSEAALRRFVDDAFGAKFAVHREQGFSIPNGIVSRYPIVEHGTWTDPGSSGTRGFAWAKIDLPGDDDLFAVSVHLKASRSSVEVRNKEASALAAAIQSAVPAGGHVVIGGDFNTENAEEPCFATLAPVVDVAGPFPADVKGLTGTNAGRTQPYDWVLVDKGLRADEVPVKLGSTTFEHGVVFDTRTFPRLEEAPPALVDDSAAPNMQHMAVARDFVLR